MPDAAPTARDIDRVTGLDGPVKTRESGQEAHGKRRRIGETQGWRLADAEELACDGIAAFASAPARCHPAAITVQIGHGGHRVADGYATHTLADGDHHASEVKTEYDGGSPSHEIEVGQLILQRVERRGGDADQNLICRRLRDGNTHRLKRQPGSVSCVTDAEKRLRNRLTSLRLRLRDLANFQHVRPTKLFPQNRTHDRLLHSRKAFSWNELNRSSFARLPGVA